jgi:hypothetical protein
MAKRSVPTSHGAIVDYWAPRSAELAHAGWCLDRLDMHTCFGCDFDCGKNRPERHHIVPYEFSQDDSPANMHL